MRDWKQRSVVLLTPLSHFRVFVNLAQLISATLNTHNVAHTLSHVYLATAALPAPPPIKPTRLFLKTRELTLDAIVPPTPIDHYCDIPIATFSTAKRPSPDSSFYSADEEEADRSIADKLTLEALRLLAVEECISASSIEVPVDNLPLKKDDLLLDGRFIGYTPDLPITHACAGLLPCILIVWEAVLTATPTLTVGMASDR